MTYNFTAKKRNTGFTLIELVVVMVILGILAVTAAPKFVSLSSDAKAATLNGIKGSLSTAVTFVQSKAMLSGQWSTTNGGGETLAFSGLTFTIYNQGVPSEKWINGFDQLIEGDYNYLGSGGQINTECTVNDFCVIDSFQITGVIGGKSGYGLFFFPKGYKLSNTDCFAYYSFSINGSGLLDYQEAGSVTSGC